MSKERVSLTVESALAEEARHYAGTQGLSWFVNEALKFYLQALRLREVEAELERQYGPIDEAARQRAAALEWPK